MNRIFLIITIFFCSANIFAQGVFIASKGEVSFYSHAPLEDITAVNSNVNSMLNLVTGEVAFMIAMRGFKFEKALMEEHFNEKYLETDKYPHASFSGSLTEKLPADASGRVRASARGKLVIHGVEKEITQDGEIEINGKDVTLTTSFRVAVAEFNISIPKLLFENIADTVDVNLKVNYTPFKKK
jgi:polyisoprenoid-binding protein YceI